MAEFADVVVIAAAEAYRGDGEIFGSGMGTIPMLGARTARATFEPDLLVSDGEAFFVANDLAIGGTDKVIEGWTPFRSVFDTVWSGRRHVMMGASQMDRFGNSNIANIGPWKQPKSQLLGVRGGPGNTISHTTSFFVPKHTSPRVHPAGRHGQWPRLRPGRQAEPAVQKSFELRRVITNLAVLDFGGPGSHDAARQPAPRRDGRRRRRQHRVRGAHRRRRSDLARADAGRARGDQPPRSAGFRHREVAR